LVGQTWFPHALFLQLRNSKHKHDATKWFERSVQDSTASGCMDPQKKIKCNARAYEIQVLLRLTVTTFYMSANSSTAQLLCSVTIVVTILQLRRQTEHLKHLNCQCRGKFAVTLSVSRQVCRNRRLHHPQPPHTSSLPPALTTPPRLPPPVVPSLRSERSFAISDRSPK
jgi:hypothetical protein